MQVTFQTFGSIFSARGEADLAVNPAEGLVREILRARRALLIDPLEIRLVRHDALGLLADRAQQLDNGLAHGGLEDAVALSGELFLGLGEGLPRRGAVDREQVGDAGLVLLVELHSRLAVGDGALELAHDVLRLVHQKHAPVGIGLAHLACGIAQAHDARTDLGNKRLGQRERIAVESVEALGDVAAELDVLLLILPHRDEIRLIEQNIRRHQHGVGKQARGDVVGVLLGFGLELGHAAQLTELRIAPEHPAQLRVLRHMALDKHDILLRIQTAGDVLRQLVDAPAAERGRILPDGDGVHVDDAVQAVVVVLQVDPVFNRAHI